jgi:hypothetical protein
MKNSTLLLILSLLLFQSKVTAQLETTDLATLDWGVGKRSSLSPERFVGYDNKKNLVFFGGKGKKGALLGGGYTTAGNSFIIYSPELKYIENIDIEIPTLKAGGEEYNTLKYIEHKKCVTLGDTSYIVGSVIGDGGLLFYAWQIDPIKKKLRAPRRIGEIKGVTKLKAEVNWTDSPNNTFGLLSVDIDKRGTDVEYVYCMIVDERMNSKNQLKAIVPYDRKDFDFKDITIDDLGRVLVTGSVKIDKADRVDRKVKNEPVLLVFSKESAPQKVNLQFEDKKIQSLKTIFNANGTGIAIGFYGNDRFSEQDGLFFSTLDANGDITKPQTHEFDTDFLVSTLSEKRQKRVKKRMDNNNGDESESDFTLREIRQMPDGSFIAIAEQFDIYVETRQPTTMRGGVMVNNQNMTQRTYYIYGDLIVARFDASGQMTWVKKIGRSRFNYNFMYERRYSSIVKGDNLYLFYQDNAQEKRNKVIDVLCAFKPDGSFEEMRLTDKRTTGAIDFEKTYQIKNDELILVRSVSEASRKKSIGRLKIK